MVFLRKIFNFIKNSITIARFHNVAKSRQCWLSTLEILPMLMFKPAHYGTKSPRHEPVGLIFQPLIFYLDMRIYHPSGFDVKK